MTNNQPIMNEFTINIKKMAFYYHGKLLLRNEIDIEDGHFQWLIRKGYFKAIPAIRKKMFTSECQRCFNKKRSLFALIPCANCQQNHLYCRKCVEMGRVLTCESLYMWTGPSPAWPADPNPCTWEGELTKQQWLAATRITQAIEKKESELLIWAVTGSGKTEMLFLGISKALQLGKRICIASPRADVVRELFPRLKAAFQQTSVQALYGGSEDNKGTAQLIISTTHQLFRYKAAFDLMIIDEIDAFPFHHDKSLPLAAKRALKENQTMIYLTATPRKDMQMKVNTQKIPHIFIPTRFHNHPLPIPSFKLCFTLKDELRKGHPPKQVIDWIKMRRNQDRQLLVFVPTIQLAEKITLSLSELLTNEVSNLKQISFVHSEAEKRKEKVDLFRKKEIDLLVTTTILERGVTFPSVDVAVIDAGHDVFDQAALVQIAGRAGRSPLDPTGEVIFFHDGLTEAMIQATLSIQKMNERGGFSE